MALKRVMREPFFGFPGVSDWCMRTVCTSSSRVRGRYAMTTYVTPVARSLIVCGMSPSSKSVSGAGLGDSSRAAYTGGRRHLEEHREHLAGASVHMPGAQRRYPYLVHARSLNARAATFYVHETRQ